MIHRRVVLAVERP